jgi:hypothetical protein
VVVFCYAWLVLAIAARGIAQLDGEHRLIGIAASLTGLVNRGRAPSKPTAGTVRC